LKISAAGHGPIYSVVGFTLPDGRALLATAGYDGTVRRWDATTGAPIGDPLTGHTYSVRTVTALTLPDGRALLATAGDDRTVRRWDAATGTPIGNPLTGHTGPVKAITALTPPDGRALLATASTDRTIRRWDATTGTPIGNPLTGHTGPVQAVTALTLPDGRALLATAGDDRAVRRWDATTGSPIGDPLTHDPYWVRAVTALTLPDGRALLATACTDGTVRRWDATTGAPIGNPLTGHTNSVEAISALTLPDGRALLASADLDGALVLWPVLASGRVAGEPTPAAAVQALSVADDDGARDALGRGVLAAHLERLVAELAASQPAGTAVIHVDGRWGSGKSTLVNLLARRMSAASGERGPGLRDPVLVRYDAWRESAVAPEWWSLTAAVNRAVRAERALATRMLMTLLGAANRVARSVPVLVAGLLLGGLLLARSAGVWSGDVAAVGGTLTALAAVAAAGLAAGRVLFWSAPAFGRLHLRAEDNPLGEIAAVVAWLRRWSPRPIRRQRGADTAFALVLFAALAWLTAVYVTDPTARGSPSGAAGWIADHAIPIAAGAVGAVLATGAWHPRRPSRPVDDASDGLQGQPRARRPILTRLVPSRVRRRARAAVGMLTRLRPRGRPASPGRPRSRGAASPALRLALRLAAGATAAGVVFLVSTTPTPASLRLPGHQHPEAWAAGFIAAAALAHLALTAVGRRHPRRPLLLILDDLDRCAADRVVKLLETVHTLLREPCRPRAFAGWRQPAPLIVVVLADGRWVRRAFETSYEPFQTLGSPVHGLGADFLQKVFDHVVLVPELSAGQVQSYLDTMTGTTPWALAERAARATSAAPSTDGGPPPPSAAAEEVEQLIDATSPGDVHGPRVRAALDQAPPQARERLAEQVAAKAATPEAVAAFSEHLLTRYARVMPANPRLVKRVANTFGMLNALSLHLGHHEDQDTIARAAIMYVRFPTLVDQLLTDPDPPAVELPAPTGAESAISHWRRRDVRQLLTKEDGTQVEITRVARCFGREYPPDPASTPPPSSNGQQPGSARPSSPDPSRSDDRVG
jgi:WD40 repeat protein